MFVQGHKKGLLEGEVWALVLEDEIMDRRSFQTRGLKCMRAITA